MRIKSKSIKTRFIGFPSVFSEFSVGKKAFESPFRLFLCGSVANFFSATDTHRQQRTKSKNKNLLQHTEGAESTEKSKSMKSRFIGFSSVFSAFSVGKKIFKPSFDGIRADKIGC